MPEPSANKLRDRAIALAGMFQASHLVQQVARKGMADGAAMQASIDSIFVTEPETVDEVYGGLQGLTLGLQLLRRQLEGAPPIGGMGRDVECSRYVIGLMHLEWLLRRRPAMLNKIRDGIERARSQAQHFHATHPNVLANLAGVYGETLSTLRYRIIVPGEQVHLSNPDNASKIRSLLLAGVRSAVLWRQRGGRRWTLIVKRRALADQVDTLLSTIDS